MELLPGFEQGERLQVLVLFKELHELVQHVAVGQEVLALLGGVPQEGHLDLAEHVPQTFLQLRRHVRHGQAVQPVYDVRYMFVVLVDVKLFEDALDLLLFQHRHVRDLLLLDLEEDAIIYLVRYLSGFFPLDLVQPFVEVIDTLVRVVDDLLGWVLVRRFFVIDQDVFLCKTVVTIDTSIVNHGDSVRTVTVRALRSDVGAVAFSLRVFEVIPVYERHVLLQKGCAILVRVIVIVNVFVVQHVPQTITVRTFVHCIRCKFLLLLLLGRSRGSRSRRRIRQSLSILRARVRRVDACVALPFGTEVFQDVVSSRQTPPPTSAFVDTSADAAVT